MPELDFNSPLWLLLTPLALIPLLRKRSHVLGYSWIEWLPEDPVGRCVEWAWRAISVLTLLSIILGLASPGRSESRIERVGRGAEISILMDRSSSMDAHIRRLAPKPGEQAKETQSKNDVVREAITWLLEQRPENRYALTLFNSAPMRVAPFTDDVAIVQSGLDASDIGRGPSETNMGLGLLAAIEAFEDRAYSGSRAIMLVSDGGARLQQGVQQLVTEGLARHRINLYFIYIQSSPNSPNLEMVGTDVDTTLSEVELHVFFSGLNSDYQVFQANDPESLAAAIARIDDQQNLPLTWFERVPRVDYTHFYFIGAMVGCALLLLLSSRQLMHWK